MDTQQLQPVNTEANIRKAGDAIAEVLQIKQEFIWCHDLLTNKTHRLVELLCEAESRGYLLEDALTLVDTAFWLEMIDWQSKFVSVVLNFTKDVCAHPVPHAAGTRCRDASHPVLCP